MGSDLHFNCEIKEGIQPNCVQYVILNRWYKKGHTLALALCQGSLESSFSLGQVII